MSGQRNLSMAAQMTGRLPAPTTTKVIRRPDGTRERVTAIKRASASPKAKKPSFPRTSRTKPAENRKSPLKSRTNAAENQNTLPKSRTKPTRNQTSSPPALRKPAKSPKLFVSSPPSPQSVRSQTSTSRTIRAKIESDASSSDTNPATSEPELPTSRTNRTRNQLEEIPSGTQRTRELKTSREQLIQQKRDENLGFIPKESSSSSHSDPFVPDASNDHRKKKIPEPEPARPLNIPIPGDTTASPKSKSRTKRPRFQAAEMAQETEFTSSPPLPPRQSPVKRARSSSVEVTQERGSKRVKAEEEDVKDKVKEAAPLSPRISAARASKLRRKLEVMRAERDMWRDRYHNLQQKLRNLADAVPGA